MAKRVEVQWISDHRRYHLEMMRATLRALNKPRGDTRRYLDIDDAEREILLSLIEKELSCGEAG